MSNAHKGSRLQLSGNPVQVDFQSAFFDFNFDATGTQYGDLVEADASSIYTTRAFEGRFGGSIAVEAGTANLISNPMFDSNINGWSNGNMATPTWNSGWNPIKFNNGFMYIAGSSGNGFVAGPTINNLTSAGTYTVSAYIEGDSMDILNKVTIAGTVFYTDGSNDDYTWNTAAHKYTKINSGRIYRIDKTFTLSNTKTLNYWQPRIGLNANYINAKLYGYQIENKSYSTSIVNGTRGTGLLKYPKSILNTDEGCISFWMYAPSNSTNFGGSPNPIYSAGIDPCFDLLIDSSGADYLRGFSSSTISTQLNPVLKNDVWSHVVVYWKRNVTFGIYIDGALSANNNSPVDWGTYYDANATGFFIGSGIRSNSNVLISDLKIDRVMPTAEDVSAWYLSGRQFFNPFDGRAYAL